MLLLLPTVLSERSDYIPLQRLELRVLSHSCKMGRIAAVEDDILKTRGKGLKLQDRRQRDRLGEGCKDTESNMALTSSMKGG